MFIVAEKLDGLVVVEGTLVVPGSRVDAGEREVLVRLLAQQAQESHLHRAHRFVRNLTKNNNNNNDDDRKTRTLRFLLGSIRWCNTQSSSCVPFLAPIGAEKSPKTRKERDHTAGGIYIVLLGLSELNLVLLGFSVFYMVLLGLIELNLVLLGSSHLLTWFCWVLVSFT